MPVFSVITAASRPRAIIDRFREQFRAQTLRDFEHVVVYDGPAPRDVVEFFALETAADARCVFAQLAEREGRYGTAPRNRGIELARGDFLVFADDDDLYHPDYLQSFADLALDENTLGVVRMSNYGTVIPRHSMAEFPRHCHVGTPSCCFPARWFRGTHALRWAYDGNYSHDFEFVKAGMECYHPRVKLNPRVVVRAANERIMDAQGVVNGARARYLNWEEPNRWLRQFSPAKSDRRLARALYRLGLFISGPRTDNREKD
jgi:glycosyltransferase involved in cell wall biosynthesis